MTTRPLNFDQANLMSKLLSSDQFKALQAKHGGDVGAQLDAELARIVKTQQAQELSQYEHVVAEQALARLRDRLDRQSKAADAVRAIDVMRAHNVRDNFVVQPANYKLADHLERIRTGSQQFRSVAHSHGYLVEHDAVRLMLETELKATVADHAAAHVAAFEKVAGEQALKDLAAKLEAKKAA